MLGNLPCFPRPVVLTDQKTLSHIMETIKVLIIMNLWHPTWDVRIVRVAWETLGFITMKVNCMPTCTWGLILLRQVFLSKTFQTKIRKLFSPLGNVKQRFHIPSMYRKRSRNYRGNKAHWLIHFAGQDADSSCSKSAFQPLQRCAPANPLRSQSAKLGHEFAVSVPWDLCSSSHANFTTSLNQSTSGTKICSRL